MSANLSDRERQLLAGQREAIVSKIEEMALAVLTADGDEGAALVAAVCSRAAEVARWAPYDGDGVGA